MIQISETAQTHFRKLIEREDIDGLGAVSYTHLDVYKRQRLGRFASGYRKRAAASCACRAAVEFSSAATPRRTAGALIPFHMLRGRRPPPDSRRRGRVARGVVQRGQSRHGADDGRICRAAVNMSTPRVVANVTAAGLVRQAGFRPDEQLTARHFLRNQTLASPPECIRSAPNATARFPPQCGCPHRSHPRLSLIHI